MSNKLKNNKKLREAALNVLSSEYMCDIVDELSLAVMSNDIKFVKNKLMDFFGVILNYECCEYVFCNDMRENQIDDLFKKCFDLMKTEPEAIEERVHENEIAKMIDERLSSEEIRHIKEKSKKELKNSGLPQELIDLTNNCEGMKIDEFYKKMDEICDANGIDVKHSELGNDILLGKNIKESLSKNKKKSNIISLDEYKKRK